MIVAYLEMVFNKLLLHQHYRIAKPSQASCFNYRWLDFNAHENFIIKFFVITVQLRKIRIFFVTKIWSHTVTDWLYHIISPLILSMYRYIMATLIATMKNTDDFHYKGKPSHVTAKSTPFTVSKDE